MAATSVILDIRANTTRALNEFKRFSSQLDNRFLVSGLKLDVVRSALGQINREFQKAIGEQGLAAGQSMRQAENQAAMLLGTFKGVGAEASRAITDQFSQAFNKIAVEAGGTAKDVQKTLSATSFISTDLSENLRKELSEGMMRFQIQARRAGFGEDYSKIIQQFLAGQTTARELINSADPLRSRMGSILSKTGGTPDAILSAQQRSRAVLGLQREGPGTFGDELEQGAQLADWGGSVIEQLNAKLFNPREGLFGTLREITMSIGDKTTIFRETRALIESVFGRQGFFVNFFAQITKIFGIEDPLKIVISGIRWLTRQFNRLTNFLESEQVKTIVDLAQKAISGIVSFFRGIYDNVESYIQSGQGQQTIKNIGTFFTNLFEGIEAFFKGEQGQVIKSYAKRAVDNIKNLFKAISDTVEAGDWNPSRIQDAIKRIGKDIRDFVRRLGESFRGVDIAQQSSFFLEIIKTLVEEITRTIGAVISEGIKTVFSSKGLAAFASIVQIINTGLTGFFTEILGEGRGGGIFAAVATAGIVAAFGKKLTLGLVAFGAKMLRALPAANFFGRMIGKGLTSLGQRISRLLRATPLHRLLPDGGGTRGAPATALGRQSIFEREMLIQVRRIAGCVCLPGFRGGGSGGPGGGRGLDPAAQARRDRVRSGRGPTGPGKIPGPDRGAILPGTQYRRAIGPLPDVRSSYLGVREARRNAILRRPTPRGSANLDQALDLYATSLEGPSPGLDFDQRREMGARVSRADTASIEKTRARYQRRYGARGRMVRGLRGFGKGALIAGGVASVSGLFESGAAQASEFDPETGEPIPQKMSAGAGFGAIGKGAAEGAMMGMMFGPKGAAIGAIIGGAISLFDKEVRDSVGKALSKFGSDALKWAEELRKGLESNTLKALSKFGSDALKWAEELRKGLVSNTLKGLDNIKTWASGIDWKQTLLDFIFPGRGIARGIAEASGVRSSGENTGPLAWFQDRIAELTGREVGGPVQAGLPYIVGERGKELFTPGTNGSITSNSHLMAALNKPSQEPASISANFTVAINVTGGLGTDNVEALRAPILAIIEQAWQEASSGTIKRGAIA